MNAPPNTVAVLIERYLYLLNNRPSRKVVDGVLEEDGQAKVRHQTELEMATTRLERAIDYYGEVAWEGRVCRTRTNPRVGRIIFSAFGGVAGALPWPPKALPIPATASAPDTPGVGASPLPEKVAGFITESTNPDHG